MSTKRLAFSNRLAKEGWLRKEFIVSECDRTNELVQQAETAFILGNYTSLKADLKHAIADASKMYLNLPKAALHGAAGILEFYSGNTEEAHEELMHSFLEDPGHAFSINQFGRFYHSQGDLSSAAHFYEMAVYTDHSFCSKSKQPRNASIWMDLVEFHLDNDNTKEASIWATNMELFDVRPVEKTPPKLAPTETPLVVRDLKIAA